MCWACGAHGELPLLGHHLEQYQEKEIKIIRILLAIHHSKVVRPWAGGWRVSDMFGKHTKQRIWLCIDEGLRPYVSQSVPATLAGDQVNLSYLSEGYEVNRGNNRK